MIIFSAETWCSLIVMVNNKDPASGRRTSAGQPDVCDGYAESGGNVAATKQPDSQRIGAELKHKVMH